MDIFDRASRDIVSPMADVNMPMITIRGVLKRADEVTPEELNWLKASGDPEEFSIASKFIQDKGKIDIDTKGLEGSASEGLNLEAPKDTELNMNRQVHNPMEDYENALNAGDIDLADRMLDMSIKQQEAVRGLSRDLSPEAMMADRLRGYQERRQGRTPSMQLTNSGEFRGDRRAPYDLEKAEENTKLERMLKLGANRRAEDSNKRQSSLLRLTKTRLKRDILNERNKMIKDLDNDKYLRTLAGRKMIDSKFKNLSQMYNDLILNNKDLAGVSSKTSDKKKYIKEADKYAKEFEGIKDMYFKSLGN